MNAEDESRMSPDQGESLHDDHPICSQATDVVVSVEQRINPDTTDKILRRAIHCSVASGGGDMDR